MLSACFDARVMRSDRGYWCLPEVDLGLPFSDGMAAAVTARLPADAAHDAMITGRRYTAEEALALGIVTDTSDEARLLDLAIDLAAPIAGKDRNVIGEHKRLLFGEAARRCGFEPGHGRLSPRSAGRVRRPCPDGTPELPSRRAEPDPSPIWPRLGGRVRRAMRRAELLPFGGTGHRRRRVILAVTQLRHRGRARPSALRSIRSWRG